MQSGYLFRRMKKLSYLFNGFFNLYLKKSGEAKALILIPHFLHYCSLTQQAATLAFPSGHKGVPFKGQLTLGQAAVPSNEQASLLACEP